MGIIVSTKIVLQIFTIDLLFYKPVLLHSGGTATPAKVYRGGLMAQ